MGLILVVEDDAVSMEMICGLIEKKGHIPLRANNGRLAWEFVKENYRVIDVLITDLMMPEVDGYELIDKMRGNEATAGLPIIVQSAYLGVKGTRRLMEKGVDAVMPKPIDNKFLMEYIERYAPN